MSKDNQIIFSKEKQHALIGHMLKDQRVYDAAAYLGFTEHIFASANDQRIFAAIDRFWKAYKRYPTVDEVRSERDLVREEQKMVDSTLKAITSAIAESEKIGLDVVFSDLVKFKIGMMYREYVEDSVNSFNRQEWEEGIEKLRDGLSKIDHMSSLGLTAQARSGAEWYDVGVENIRTMPDRLIKTGIGFIDEATHGLKPDDLMIVTSLTGYGKSQLMALMAYNMAAQGRKVKLFALEAGKAEIEMRIRFAKMLENYYKTEKTAVDYVEWCRGLRPDLEKFEPNAAEIKKVLSNVNITYKQTSNYGIEQLERDIFAVAKEVDVVLVDHLHYIDRDAKKTEAEAVSKIVSRIRDMNLTLGVPFILAAHVKKHQGPRKEKTLLPDIDDIYSSGDVSKVATWVLALGQPVNVDDEKVPIDRLRDCGYGAPTFVRFLKSRDGGGSRTSYTIVAFFSRGVYHARYTIGRMSGADTKWDECARNEFPPWAKSAFMLPPERAAS